MPNVVQCTSCLGKFAAPDSLVVEEIPDSLVVNATSDTPGLDGSSVMGFRHRDLPIHGVQFHPESIATEHGHALLANFLKTCGIEAREIA